MAKKVLEIKIREGEEASGKLPSADQLREAMGVEAVSVSTRRLNEIGSLLFFHENVSEDEVNIRLLRAVEQFERLSPADGAENMLALQMVGTHEAALECLRRAALRGQTFEGRDMALKHAHKLMSLYAQQLAALDKHRGKGQQKVTVEHVNVAPGGQAIVGNVTHQRSAADEQSREMLENHETPVVETPLRKASVKRRKS